MQKKINKIIIAPDSFKGTMSSIEVGKIIADAVRAVLPECGIISLAIADGGEGSIDAFLHNNSGIKVPCRVTGPNFKKVDCVFGLIEDKAIVEIAQCAGLPLAEPKNPGITTTFGVGELIDEAIKRGAREITLALGGSATNDCGAGMAAVLGAVFYNKEGKAFVPVGETLRDIVRIDISGVREKLRGIKIKAMCDVKNVLYGENGAAYIYAGQKGAGPKQITELDEGLRHIARIIYRDTGVDVSSIQGGGAAGGLGAACAAFLGGSLISGIDAVLEMCGFEETAADADIIITGEGKFDRQSLMGKVVDGISKKSPDKAKLIVIAGKIDISETDYKKAGIYAVFQTSAPAKTFEQIKRTCREDLYLTAKKAVETLL